MGDLAVEEAKACLDPSLTAGSAGSHQWESAFLYHDRGLQLMRLSVHWVLSLVTEYREHSVGLED